MEIINKFDCKFTTAMKCKYNKKCVCVDSNRIIEERNITLDDFIPDLTITQFRYIACKSYEETK